jgi:Xaa-Pro aminopeptidase
MTKLFENTFFSNNRKRLRELVGAEAPIVIAAHGLLQKSGDSTFAFHQDSNFWYLTGINEPDLILVIDEMDEYIMVPGRSGSREAFDGAVDFDELMRLSGVKNILSEEDGWKKLGGSLKMTSKAQTLLAPPPYIEQYGLYTNPARARLSERLQTWGKELETIDIREQLAVMRIIKQPEELDALQLAIDTTLKGLQKVSEPERLSRYEFEFEIENDLSSAFRTESANGHGFTPIVASGKRACTLHNFGSSGKLKQGELLVMDVGAEVSHYAADITRTVAIGEPSKRQRQVFDAVLDVQKFALELLRPGNFIKENESKIEEYMGRKLIELGLIKKIDRDNVRAYYPHATSHFLGLDVHDVGDYSRPLEAGMVLTCEPGIYIPEESIGVRIEDDILITADGYKVLSSKLPSRLSASA